MTASIDLAKDERYVNKKITQSARGQQCTLHSPACRGRHDTVVWAHSPFAEHGHAGSRKAHDCHGCYACQDCHDWLDGRGRVVPSLAKRRQYFYPAMAESLLILVKTGVLT